MPVRCRKAFVFIFDCIVWMNTFCQAVCCMYVQLNKQCCNTRVIVAINIILRATYTTYISSEKEVALSLCVWGSLLTATAGMWVNRQTSELWGKCLKALSHKGRSREWCWGDRPPQTYESNFFHHDFVQFGKQHSRLKRTFCLPVFYPSSVVKYTSSLWQHSEPVMRLDCQVSLKSLP